MNIVPGGVTVLALTRGDIRCLVAQNLGRLRPVLGNGLYKKTHFPLLEGLEGVG
jgi:hypothetical protein